MRKHGSEYSMSDLRDFGRSLVVEALCGVARSPSAEDAMSFTQRRLRYPRDEYGARKDDLSTTSAGERGRVS
jgi:hypothetical protein